jgi:hypothetical protein
MHAELSPSPQRVKLALQACPFVGAVLLADDKPRPGEPSDGSMFCASLCIPSSAVLHALVQLEKLLPPNLPAWIVSHGGLLGLLLESVDALDAMVAPACSDRGLQGFDSSSAYANIHERKLWSVLQIQADRPLIGLAFSYYGSGGDGKLGAKTFYSRDAFSSVWSAMAERLATRLELDEAPAISESLIMAPHLHGFHTEIPQGLQDMWSSQAERSWLRSQLSSGATHPLNPSKIRAGL